MKIHQGNRGWCSLLGLLVVATPAIAQQARGTFRDEKQMPSGPVGERIREFLDVLNSGQAERIRELVSTTFTPQFRDQFPLDEHVGVISGLYKRSRGLEFYSIRKYESPPADAVGETVVIAQNKLTEAWHGIVFHVESNPPHRIAGLMFSPARPPIDLPQSTEKLTVEQVVAELETFLARLVSADAFSGAVLVAKNGKPFFVKSYGQACKSFDVSNRADTKFNLGSMNKMFTAVAIVQLAEKGELSFQDKIGKYLSSDWLPGETADHITIEHLLTHTSGLGSYFNEKYDKSSRLLFREVKDYKPLVQDDRPSFEPGTKWAYSNTGFLLLGAIIEKVTGQSYFDYMREKIYQPAGMMNTDCYDVDVSVPNLALGYSAESGADGKTIWRTNVFQHVVRGGPAGGGYSTVEDLLRFDAALRTNKLVSARGVEWLWTAKPNSPDYGYGFGLRTSPDGGRIVGHSGGFSGINSVLDMYLDSGYTVVVMSNYDGGAMPVSQKIGELIGRAK